MDEEQGRVYARLLEEAGRFHGDVCRGIEIGTRMTMAGLAAVGITDPKGADRKSLLVFAEIDRCATDAITALTGCRPGKRTMKVLDYGKMAATFVNLKDGRAVRIGMREKREDNREVLDAIATMPDEALFSITPVDVDLRPEDLPGPPLHSCTCARCGETVLDGREVEAEGEILCRPCAAGRTYYRVRGGNGA
jgi:formylmethanofuran dehydrogenase subunit E